MKSRFIAAGLVGAALLVLVLVPGCFKIKQMATVMPDGSGKLSITFGFNEKQIKEMLAGLGGGGGDLDIDDPTEKLTGDTLADGFKGFVAFSEPVVETTDDGWKIVTVHGYFEDLNKVEILEDPEEADSGSTTFVLKKEGDGHYLECHTPDKDAEGAPDEGAEEAAEMFKDAIIQMFEGFEMSYGFRMPGPVTKTENLPVKEGRVAKFVLTDKDLKDLKDLKKLKELGKGQVFKVWCGPSEVSDTELAEFKAEMSKAVTDYKARQAKAAAEKKAAEKEEDGEDK